MGASAEASGDRLVLGRPQPLSSEPYFSPRLGRPYDVSLDGARFLRLSSPEPEEVGLNGQLILIQNWADEVSRIVTPWE